MPEGHILFRLARDIEDAFAGSPVRVASPQGRFAGSAALVDGAVMEGADSWGKHLFLRFSQDRVIHIHLGLYGKFNFDQSDGSGQLPDPVGAVRLRLVGPAGAYADLRGPTTCRLIDEDERSMVLARSGPDPLRPIVGETGWERVRRTRRPIGSLLMDQSVVAGAGNIYRAEVLFRARIHPLRPAATLRAGQWEGMWQDLVTLMADGVRTGRIDTVRPEHTPEAMGRDSRVDDHGGEVYVYRRAGLPCLVCTRPVRTDILEGRNLFWCSNCQRAYRARL